MMRSFLIAMPLLAGLCTAASAASTGLCDFVAKVAKSEPGHFMAFKGAEDSILKTDHDIFDGTLTPDGALNCKLYLRKGDHGYSCDFATAAAADDAAALYKQKAQELLACPTGWKFTETNKNDTSTGDIYQGQKMHSKTLDVILSSTNGYALMARMFGDTSTGPAPFAVTLEFEDNIKASGQK